MFFVLQKGEAQKVFVLSLSPVSLVMGSVLSDHVCPLQHVFVLQAAVCIRLLLMDA